ncbi:hypothetical protein FOFC_17288 [Fusarium oxysporum]|nr:hypothetical protein FocnCong_v010702 [Fusarium oxysporum f. sp. conglutinans]KAI8401983.1 hypothetical protein FOFC_17288 [Fusarium oxysporum]
MPATQPGQQQHLEDRLFRHFRGWTWSERSRDTSSWLWDFGYDIQRHGLRKWACKDCILVNRPTIASFTSSGLQNAANHLWREHKTPAPEGEKKSTAQLKSEGALKSNQPTIASVLKLDVNKPTEQNIANNIISRFDKQHFQRMLVELIVSSNQSLSFAENPTLQEIFDYLDPSVSIQRANLTARAVRYKIIQEYDRHRQKVIEALRNSPGALHISFDGWTSRNKLALYGIACFFRDEKNRPCKIMIGVPEAHRHFGFTIGGEVLDVLHTLGVGPEKIGYFTLDNAENNDTAMEVIGGELGFDGRLRRGRCIGHTINLSAKALSAKALLFGKNADAFEQQSSSAEALSDTEYARWRKKGPVGKLQNIVVGVRISHRLIYLFKEVQRDEIDRAATLKLRSKKPFKLIIDNDTRWLSQLYMIRRALRLKTSIELLLIKLAKKPRILRDENQLTDKDWEVLYHLEAILTVFETVVKTLEGYGHIRRRKQGWTGSYGNIWDVVLGYELLLNTLEEYKQLAADFPDPEHFRIGINLGINLAWDKLDEYYRRLDETPIYYTAMALHPAYHWDWFDETWAHKPSWVEKAKEMVGDVWLSDYAHLEVRTSSSRGDDEPPAKRPRFFNPFEKNSRVPNSLPAHAAAIVGDEYQAWQTDRDASDGNVRDPIGYWITKQSRYPRLSRMALDFLTIQPMSAECERLFSAAGKMVSGLRTNLDAEIIAICQVLRSWYRAGLIKDLDPLLKSHLESKHDAGCGTLNDGELALAETKWLLEGEDSVSEVDDTSQQQQAEELVSTSEKNIVAAFEQHKQKVIEVLGEAPGLIHISFDGWRSGNRYALYGVCCFFRDENNKPCKITLGLPVVSARHTGPNIATEILDVIESYQIQDKIGYFTLDNAKNNDTAMEIIGGELGFVGARRRGRCFGHTVNLSAKAILFGHDADAFERRISGAEPLTEAEPLIWRKKGPAGKLHNLVVAIHRSDLLTGMLRNIQQEAFNKSSDPKLNARKPLNVILDNDTRWLSHLYMIRRALLLRDYIERLIAHHRIGFEQQNKAKRGGPKKSLTLPFIYQPENQLSDKDWEVVEIFAQILSYYEATIKMLEGDGRIRKRKRGWTGPYGNIWDVIQGFEFLLEQLERFKDIAKDFPDTEHFRININLGWQKLNEYYETLSDTPIYYTGLALHPAYRWKWFERNWTDRPEWIDEAKNMVHDVWRFEYREAALPGQEPPAVEPVPKQRKTSDNPFQEYLK